MKDKIKVLMIGPARNVNGGISTVVNNYYKAGLDKRIHLRYIGTMEDGSRLHKLRVAIRALFRFIIQAPKCDLVHINMASDVSLYRKLPFIYLTKLFGKKLVIHQHGGNIKEFYYKECKRKQRDFIRKSLRKADVFLVVSPYLEEIFKDIIDERKLTVLPNAICLPEDIEEKKPGEKLIFLGRLCRQKGIEELLEAVSELKGKYPGLELYLAGVWEDLGLKELADRYGDFVHQLGWIGSKEKDSYLRRCNIFVLPTYFEGMPMSLLEGMAYGCTCIASAVGGIPYVLENGTEGILIRPKSKEALKQALVQVLDDSSLQKKFSGAAKKRVTREFEIKKSVDALVKIYGD